jgi:probable addiction module antidote protein
MEPVKTTVWDPANYLDSDKKIKVYLKDAFESGNVDVIIAAIGDVSRAIGMSNVAKKTKLGRESLYKSLAKEGNPSFSTVIKVMSALGYSLKPRLIKAS